MEKRGLGTGAGGWRLLTESPFGIADYWPLVLGPRDLPLRDFIYNTSSMIPFLKKLITSEWFWIAGLTGLSVLAASLPYWLAYTAPAPYLFGGILVNPLD